MQKVTSSNLVRPTLLRKISLAKFWLWMATPTPKHQRCFFEILQLCKNSANLLQTSFATLLVIFWKITCNEELRIDDGRVGDPDRGGRGQDDCALRRNCGVCAGSRQEAV